MQGKTIGIIVVALLLAVGGYFLMFKGGYQTSTPVSTPAEKTLLPTQSLVSQFREITVVGTEFRYNPASISVKTGEKVKILFKNNGKASHNLVVERLGISTKTIGSGQTDVLEFTAPITGTYALFCSLPGHRAKGMEGNLKVE